MELREVKADLFTDTEADMLVHCISADAKMGAGIAKTFNRKYPQMKQHILDMSPEVGGVVNYFDRTNNRYIANLITKPRYFQKPMYKTLEKSLVRLRRLVEDKGVAHIAMPRIGSGLDKLDWKKNLEIIKRVFENVDVKITVYYL